MSAYALPPIEALLEAHREYLEEFGGESGVRDLGRLEAALGRAENLIAYGDNPSLFEVAAVVSHGVLRNHAFVDGNKRVAFGVIVAILEMNEYSLDATERDAIAIIHATVEGKADEATLSEWIDRNAVRTAATQD